MSEATETFTDEATRPPSPDLLRLLDVGASGGLEPEWLPHVERVHAIMVEPNVGQARLLEGRFPHATIIPHGLWNLDGPQRLHITRNHKCISLLKPNIEFLKLYKQDHAFEVLSEQTVTCWRYDTIVARGEAPAPEVVKLDVQGAEYEVLLGMGSLLAQCLAVKLESHFYPIYHGQKLLGDIVDLLSRHGLTLSRIDHHPNFGSDMVEVDAVFLAAPDRLDEAPGWKRTLITQVYGVQGKRP